MKKIFIAVTFLLMGFVSIAQITLEHTYNSLWPFMIYFKYTSPKWMTIDLINNEIKLYNLNHSLYKQITIPQQDSTYGVFYVTEDLFDNDSTNLEYLVFSILGQPGYVRIYREDSTLLFARDSAFMRYQGITTNGYFVSNIVATDSGTKLMLPIANPSLTHYEIYSLPGSLPCLNPCDENFVGIHEPVSNNYQLNNPYPNPSSSQTNIPIELPPGANEGEIVLYNSAGNEIKRYKVDRTFSYLVLSTADLAVGSYYYQLQAAKSNSTGKKLIVIK